MGENGDLAPVAPVAAVVVGGFLSLFESADVVRRRCRRVSFLKSLDVRILAPAGESPLPRWRVGPINFLLSPRSQRNVVQKAGKVSVVFVKSSLSKDPARPRDFTLHRGKKFGSGPGVLGTSGAPGMHETAT